MTKNNSNLRAVGYSRTSGPNYTSLDNQREAIEKFIDNNNWLFVSHYIDECKSGSKVAGRNDFQQMMKDATQKIFDIIVPYDISRFARDGCDIVSNAKFLKSTFGIFVIDSKGLYDNRSHDKVLLNYVHAGEAEADRLRIMERTIKGRIKRAEKGEPWSATSPFGRAFDEESGRWYLTDEGKEFAKLLERYANGEQVKKLAQEYQISSVQTITRIVRESQLSVDDFKVTFNSPEIGIVNHVITIPNFPKVITPDLEKRVRERMKYNRKWNKIHKRKYLLSGFVNCAHCGKALKGQTQRKKSGDIVYYRHSNYLANDRRDCKYKSIKAEILENHVLDYLYAFYFDEPAFNAAVKAALPSDDDRMALLKDIQGVEKRLAQSSKEVSNLARAIAKGADVSLLLDTQNDLIAEKQVLENRLDELNQTLVSMPDPKLIERQANSLWVRLFVEHTIKDWRNMPYDEVRRYLNFLFSDNPQKNGYGISVAFEDGRYTVSFNGRFDFPRELTTDENRARRYQAEISRINTETKVMFAEGVAKIEREYEEDCAKAQREYEEACEEVGIKPEKDYLYLGCRRRRT